MPERLFLSYYGDDFTGSTDVLEALTLAGFRTVLFMAPPQPETLAAYPGLEAMGIAGTSRSRSPEWMDQHLPQVFEALKSLGARLCHYKTCSTFDSSPEIGSVGRAIEIGRKVFGTARVPVVVGVPRLRRWVFFGNLFAGYGDEVFRIDRHPVMRRHPSTPMREADLALHLSAQTDLKVATHDREALVSRRDLPAADIAVLDTHDDATSCEAGRVVWEAGETGPAFVAGSSGVEYALADFLRSVGRLSEPPSSPAVGPADQLVVASGSASSTTAAQIGWAEAQGWPTVALDPTRLIARPEEQQAAAVARVREALSDGRSIVLHTARGPDDPRIPAARAALAAAGLRQSDSALRFGQALGLILRNSLSGCTLPRIVLAGGDTTGHAAEAMGIEALEMIAPLVPGSPLCRARARGQTVDGAEIVMKGGQVGAADYFEVVRSGRVKTRRKI